VKQLESGLHFFMSGRLFTSLTKVVNTVLSTNKMMIPARKRMDEHAQYFMVRNLLLLLVLKTFAHYIR
jgi:hypothetical protein